MKKRACMFLAILLVFALPIGLAEQSGEVEAPGTAPVDLLGEAYNPFFDVAFPDGYEVYRAEYGKEEYNLFYLYLIAEDTAENVVTFMSNLLGDSAPDSIRQNLDYLNRDGMVRIDGSWIEAGLNADCEIYPTERDKDYRYVEGYVIALVKSIEESDMYDAFLEANLNLNALPGVAESIDLFPIENATFKVYVPNGPARLDCRYSLPDAAMVKEDLIGALADSYVETGDRISLTYGDLHAEIKFSGVQDGNIDIGQQLNRTDVSLGEYAPQVSLKSLGFEDFRDTSAKCTYRDDESGVFLSVSRSEWGENAQEGERNAVTFMKKMGDGLLVVFYDPETKTYLIQIDSGGAGAKYEYRAADNAYADEFGGDDLESAKQVAGEMFGRPGEDDVLRDAWTALDLYLEKTFGIGGDELFKLDYEP